jgi:C-methyltransferase-like protein/putative zinc binding protein/methyltransferase family protein
MGNVISSCRSCGSADLQPVLSLGKTPLANALLTAEQLTKPEENWPLDLVLCPKCALAQITETVPAETLFREYLYLSSFSDALLKHAESIATLLTKTRNLNQHSLVVEVASNDGYLLQYYKRAGIPVLGIEPARNLARLAETERGIPTINEFFNARLAAKLASSGQRADCIHAHNVLAHMSDLNDAVKGFATLLKPGGAIVVEVPYVRDLVTHCEFDTIYHEHLCYFSLTSLDHLFRRHEMTIEDVEHQNIHGGTLRIFVGHAGAVRKPRPAVSRMLDEEAACGVAQIDFYRGFAAQVGNLRQELVGLLQRLKSEGKRIAAYGASAKGSTLLNYFGVGADVIDFVVDRSTVKQGYYTPGTYLPIYPPEKLLADMPDYVLLLTWNFANEILEQQSEYRRKGGRFIIPIPSVEVV